MKAKKQRPMMTELLRKALAECDSLRAVERATGVSHQSAIVFLSGKSLRLDKADALGRHFGIECRMKRQARKGAARKGR